MSRTSLIYGVKRGGEGEITERQEEERRHTSYMTI